MSFGNLFIINYMNLNPQGSVYVRTHHLNLTIMLSVDAIHIGSALAEGLGQGLVGAFRHGAPCTCQLSWLSVLRPRWAIFDNVSSF